MDAYDDVRQQELWSREFRNVRKLQLCSRAYDCAFAHSP
jgi:hypothetical protein